ncbi:MAG: glycine cleavage system aminomethyltransferase GcvT [Proteobacteria bacterium]|jgi:aminomethyltransferase|nr:glycine cleavage system aminomethyltransferase GcvT [Pseudomonadota bacterium]
MSKATVLNRLHREAGARMVDFGGWDMPVSYGSQIDEHHAVRRDAGMFDVSHMRAVDLRGGPPAPRDLLRYALANNVDKLKAPGKALYSCLLRGDGGVLDDLIVYFMREDWFRLVVNAATTDKDLAWLSALVHERASQVTLEPRDDLAMIAVQGPQARAKVWAAIAGSEAVAAALAPFTAATLSSPQFGELFIARTGYTGEDGFEITVPGAHAEALWTALRDHGVAPCGLGARDTLRLEAGMNLYGQDMDESVSPLESGLAWTVDLASSRDFSGKEALAATKPARRLAGLLLCDEGGVLRAHQRVHTDSGDGEVTSGTWAPTLARSIALARVPAAVADGAMVEVEVRGKRLVARVVKPPFVRHGVALVS